MHYYQHHIGDFIKDTANLNDHQLATYMRMIWAYYSEERPFSEDIEDIAFAMRSDEKTVSLILRHYFKNAEDGWHHSRCDREIAEFHKKSEKAAASANARWNNANAMRTHSERNANEMVLDANQEPITKNKEKTLMPKSADSAPCQMTEIIELYHERLPELPRVRVMTKTRETQIRQRWREDPGRQSLDWWERFFDYVAKSDFLMGRTQQNNRTPFLADLEWLTKAGNFAKVIEGKYHA